MGSLDGECPLAMTATLVSGFHSLRRLVFMAKEWFRSATRGKAIWCLPIKDAVAMNSAGIFLGQGPVLVGEKNYGA